MSSKVWGIVIFALALVLLIAFYASVFWSPKRVRTIRGGLYKLLAILKQVCEDNGLRFWITGGTLLGAVRHRSIIPWDDDADVIMLEPDFEIISKLDLRPYGVKIHHFSNGFHRLKLLNGRQGGAFVDIFAGVESGDMYVLKGKWRFAFPNERHDKPSLHTCNPIRLGKLTLCSPKNPTEYLQRTYGENWKTPAFTKFHHWSYLLYYLRSKWWVHVVLNIAMLIAAVSIALFGVALVRS